MKYFKPFEQFNSQILLESEMNLSKRTKEKAAAIINKGNGEMFILNILGQQQGGKNDYMIFNSLEDLYRVALNVDREMFEMWYMKFDTTTKKNLVYKKSLGFLFPSNWLGDKYDDEGTLMTEVKEMAIEELYNSFGLSKKEKD